MFFRIKNWAEFQHYRDRSPPWIKLHRNLLTSRTWVALSSEGRVLAIASMMLAADTDNKIPADPDYLRRVAYLDFTPDLQALADVQFIEFIDNDGNLLADASKLLANASSEERRGEERQRRAEQSRPMSSSKANPTAVDRIFDHWRSVHGHDRAKLDDKRRRLIGKALKDYDEATLCQAITGYLHSPHHQGQNDRGTKYDGLELILRDAAHIDAGLRFYADPPANVSRITRANIAAVEDWRPPELRAAT